MNKLVLVGAGGHCKSVLDVALRMKTFDQIVITDPIIEAGTIILGCEVVGTDDKLIKLRNEGFDNAFITVGSIGINPNREKLAEKLEKYGYKFPTIIDPSASIAETACIGAGVFIGKKAVVNTDTRIGCHCIINTGAIIEHECFIDEYAHVSVGSILCGQVHVGRHCFIGAGSTIIQCLKIGDKVVIGANSTVLNNVEDNVKRYGIV